MTEKAKQSGNQPANPCLDNNDYAGQIKLYAEGLTKREYFAGLAMQALNSNMGANCRNKEYIAKSSVEFADALLEELSKAE